MRTAAAAVALVVVAMAVSGCMGQRIDCDHLWPEEAYVSDVRMPDPPQVGETGTLTFWACGGGMKTGRGLITVAVGALNDGIQAWGHGFEPKRGYPEVVEKPYAAGEGRQVLIDDLSITPEAPGLYPITVHAAYETTGIGMGIFTYLWVPEHGASVFTLHSAPDTGGPGLVTVGTRQQASSGLGAKKRHGCGFRKSSS